MNRQIITALILGMAILTAIVAWGVHDPPVQVSGNVYLSGDGTPAAGVRIVFFDLSDLRRSFSTTTDEEGRFTVALEARSEASSTLPKNFRLLQNFPNPFNPSTTIPYELRECQFAADRLPAFSAKVYHRFSPKGYHFASVSAAPMQASDSCGWTN